MSKRSLVRIKKEIKHYLVQMFKRSDFFLLLGVMLSFFVSGYLWFNGQRLEGLFTAIWVPSILGFGIYFKLMMIWGKIND